MSDAIGYDRGKLLGYGGFLIALAAAFVYLFADAGEAVIMAFALLMGGAGAFFIYKAQSDNDAIRFDQHGMTISLLWNEKRVEWSEFISLSSEVYTYRVAGFIPVFWNRVLVFRATGGVLGTKTIRLTSMLLDLPDGGVDALMTTVRRLQVTVEAGMSIANPGALARHDAAATAARPVASGYDADAAFERMMARRQLNQTAISPQSDRDILPTPPAATPARPVFGRKVG